MMVNETLDSVTTQLEHARREAAYYRKLAQECGKRRLQESEELSELITQLRQTEKELAQSRAELELRVQERTTELQATNAQLRCEVHERQRIEEQLHQMHEKLKRSYAALEHEQRHLEEKVQVRTQEIVRMQQERVRELWTPLIPVSDNVVVMPLIGTIDPERAQQVRETLLEGVAACRATVAILDITGVRVMDMQVAQGIIQAAQAVKLLGAQVVLTGIQPLIAQALVRLGIELNGIVTRSTLQAGIGYAMSNNTHTYAA